MTIIFHFFNIGNRMHKAIQQLMAKIGSPHLKFSLCKQTYHQLSNWYYHSNKKRTLHTILSPNYYRKTQKLPIDRKLRKFLWNINEMFKKQVVYSFKFILYFSYIDEGSKKQHNIHIFTFSPLFLCLRFQNYCLAIK